MFGWFKKKSTTPFVPSPSSIVPRIKTNEFTAVLKSVHATPDEFPFIEPFVGNLLVTYAFDLPSAFIMATESEIKQLGVRLEDVRRLALSNVQQRCPKIEIHHHGTIRQIVLGDDLEACMLLADSFWDQAAGEVSGDVVVSVPSRNVVVYCGSESEVGLHALRAVADQVMKSETTHALTEELFVRRNGRWTKFEEQNP
jgi:uncharacterized protein YtpQ (UPF0354 family)